LRTSSRCLVEGVVGAQLAQRDEHRDALLVVGGAGGGDQRRGQLAEREVAGDVGGAPAHQRISASASAATTASTVAALRADQLAGGPRAAAPTARAAHRRAAATRPARRCAIDQLAWIGERAHRLRRRRAHAPRAGRRRRCALASASRSHGWLASIASAARARTHRGGQLAATGERQQVARDLGLAQLGQHLHHALGVVAEQHVGLLEHGRHGSVRSRRASAARTARSRSPSGTRNRSPASLTPLGLPRARREAGRGAQLGVIVASEPPQHRQTSLAPELGEVAHGRD
jgi:hypothetical protein